MRQKLLAKQVSVASEKQEAVPADLPASNQELENEIAALKNSVRMFRANEII